jgi:hypothetical protein
MRALAFDFAVRRRVPGWAGWLLLALGIGFVADVARNYLSLQAEIARMEARASRVEEIVGKPAPGLRAASGEEFVAARAVVARFAIPWPTLFSAIESVQVDDVSLLSIEPDASTGLVVVNGEGKNYLAVLTYVARLSAHPGFARVHLSRHEIRDSEPRRPVSFSVVAQWRRL